MTITVRCQLRLTQMASDSERVAPRERGEPDQSLWAPTRPSRLERLHVDEETADSSGVDGFPPTRARPTAGREPVVGKALDPDLNGYGRPPGVTDRQSNGHHTEAKWHDVDPAQVDGGGRTGSEDDDDHEFEYEDYFDDDEDDEDGYLDAASSATRNALEWAVVLVGAVLVALVLRASLFQAFYIPSESMETTLLIDDRVLVNKISYRLHDINRGDIVVFARPDDQAGEIRDLIKRVVALPGESVEARDNSLFINGQRLEEPYLDENVVTVDFGPEVVPEGQVFVMGDNRTESYDSRVFGAIDQDRVVGRAFVLFWPLNRLGSL